MPTVHLIHYGKDLELRGTKLDTLDKIDLSSEQSFEFYPNHRYLVVWNDTSKTDDTQPVKILQQKYHIHFGPRRETFYDYVKCSYLTTIDGIIFKFMYKKYELHQEWINEEQYESMLPNLPKIKQRLKGADLWTGVSKKTGKQWYKFVFDQLKDIGDDITDFIEKDDYIKPSKDVSYVKRVRTNEEIENAFTYFLNKPEGTTMGLDYETHGGWPMDSPDFEPVGVGIACGDDGVCAYFDIQWMQYRGGNLEFFKQWYNKYLDKFENSVTYNNSFEQRTTYLLLHRLCLFNEAAAINKCDGLVAKRYSLKYTVQRCLHIRSWDDKFDLLNDILPKLWDWNEKTKEYHWKITADGENEIETSEGPIRVPNDYKHNPIWKQICDMFPDEIEEFKYLIEHFYGDSFACIPSNIQTQYCCRDAYYTALLELDCKSRYSQLCWSTYNNNLRMEALLHLTGFFQDEDYRISLSKQCFWLMAHGYMNMVRFIAGTRIKEFEKTYGKLTLPKVIENLINEGFDIRDSKSWVMANLDDSTESGVSEQLRSIVGDDLFNLVESRIKEYCVHIDESYRRSRKVFTIIDADIKEIYNPIYDQNKCSWVIDGQAVVVEQPIEIIKEYFNSKKYLSEMDDMLSQVKFDDINNLVLPHVGESNLPEKLIIHGRVNKELTPQEIFEYCSEICNLKSIKTVPPVQFMIIRKYYDLMLHFGSIPYGDKLSEDIDIHKPFKLPDDSLYKKLCDENYPPAIVLKNAKLLMEEDEGIKNTIYWNKYLINHDPMELVYMAMTDGDCFKVDSGKFDKNGKKIYERTKDAEDWLKLYNDTFFNYLEWYLIKQLGYFVARREDQLWIAEHIDDIDILDESIASLAKINWCYGSFKKYDKVQGTYLNGTHFTDSKIECDYFDEQGVTPNRYEKKGVFKSYLTFNANEKKSKRY